MKFLILLFYYERPEMLKNALESIKSSTYSLWDLCVIDDGVNYPGFSVINECFSKEERESHKISYIQTMDSSVRKMHRGGSQFGEYANTAIRLSDADIVFMLCDDDLVKPDYMEKLDLFYRENPEIRYSYSHLQFYNPCNGLPSNDNTVDDGYTRGLVSQKQPINPVRRVDSSQISWRRDHWLKDGISFPCPRTSNLDEVIYGQMYSSWGSCSFNGINGQWKGIHDGQLINLARKRR